MDADNEENNGCSCCLLVALGAMALTGIVAPVVYGVVECLIIAMFVVVAWILLLILYVEYLFILKVLLIATLVLLITQIVKILVKCQAS